MATTTDKEKKQNHNDEPERNMMNKAKETAAEIGDKARETAAEVGEKAKQAGTYVRDRADDAVSGAGKGIENAANAMRQGGPQSGMFGKANDALANTLDRTGEYLEEQGLSGMAEDMTDMIRRHPVPAVLIGVGVGFLLARMTSTRS